jgi:hypothetical protein
MISSLSSFAVFVLATSHIFDNITSFDSRIIPIVQTWGSLFNRLFFVFGNHPYDAMILKQRCQRVSFVVSKGIFAQQNNYIEEYRCLYHKNISTHSYIHDKGEFHALRLGFCEGSYYGRGPTCRCEMSLKWYLNASTTASTDWFMFIDDDIYVRPHALGIMIQSFEQNMHRQLHVHGSKDSDSLKLAITADIKKNGMELSKKWNRTHYNCSDYYVGVTMPLIMNRKAVEFISGALNDHAMIRLQRIWGGTHDMIIGLLLSSLGVPIYSFEKYYHNELVSKDSFIHANLNKSMIMVHKVKNMRKIHHVKKITTQVVSQYDMAAYFHDCYSWSSGGCGQTAEEVASLLSTYDQQMKCGIQASNSLRLIPNYLHTSSYQSKYQRYLQDGRYELFTFEDCGLKI